MDPTDRICIEFDRLVALGRSGVALCPREEQFVYYIVATRCEIDIDGFSSVYEQDLTPAELAILIEGLQVIEESSLAAEFERGYELLNAEGYYPHMNWIEVSPVIKDEIRSIGKRVGDKLWDLDEKLASLLT